MLRKFFKWIFKAELAELEKQIQESRNDSSKLKNTLNSAEQARKVIVQTLEGIDISVDVHESGYSRNWAVISLQGQKSDYIKFIDMNDRHIEEIARFLRQYERQFNIKVDASPYASPYLRFRK